VPFHFEIFNSLKFNEITDFGKEALIWKNLDLVSMQSNYSFSYSFI
jgi:hypothetical protein